MKCVELSIRRTFGDSHHFGPPLLAAGEEFHQDYGAIERLRELCRSKEILLLIHGYNSPVDRARAAYQAVEAQMAEHYDLFVRCYWPGSRKTLGFPWAFERADDAGCLLRGCFDGIRAAALDVITHSLGARVWAWMFRGIAGPMRYAVLTGAAVPQRSVSITGKHYRATQAFQRVLVAHSRHDEALRMYEWSTFHRALGKRGPAQDAAPNCCGVDCSQDTPDHGGYRRSEILYRAWRGVIGGKQC